MTSPTAYPAATHQQLYQSQLSYLQSGIPLQYPSYPALQSALPIQYLPMVGSMYGLSGGAGGAGQEEGRDASGAARETLVSSSSCCGATGVEAGETGGQEDRAEYVEELNRERERLPDTKETQHVRRLLDRGKLNVRAEMQCYLTPPWFVQRYRWCSRVQPRPPRHPTPGWWTYTEKSRFGLL